MSASVILAVVAVKQLATAKSRLIGLEPAMRAALMLRMAQTTLDALHGAGALAGSIVVTSDPQIAALAAARAMQVLPDPAAGLNAALDSGLAAAWRSGASHALIVHADFLALTPADIDGLVHRYLAQDAAALGLVACRHGTGTNAALVPRELDFVPQFGEASLARHLGHAGGRGMMLDCPALAWDIDRAEDLERPAAG